VLLPPLAVPPKNVHLPFKRGYLARRIFSEDL
jgi:hypothetical protein